MVTLQDLGASYARISDNDGAGAGVGCADQHRRNRQRAASDNIDVTVDLTDDDRSAFKKNVVRDDYQRLLALIRDGKICYVLVRHADRLHRQPAEAEVFIELAQQHKVTVVTASGMRYLLNTAEGRKAFREAAVAAASESDIRSERVAQAHERRALAGEYRGSRNRPFGWGVPTGVMRRVRDKKTGQRRDVEILDMTLHNAAEADEIRRWAKDLLAGVKQGQVLRSARLPTITGGPWTNIVMQQILKSPRTSGHSVYRGEIVARGVWEPILEDDVRLALMTMFADPSRRTSPGNIPKWLGSLIYLCGYCERDSNFTDRRKYTMHAGRSRQGYQVYRCRLRGHCNRRAHALDTFVEDVMIERLSRDDIADLMPGPARVDVAGLREEVTVLEQRKVEVALVFSGNGDAAALAAAKAQLDNQIAALQEQLSVASAVSPLAEFDGVNTVKAARRIWEDSTLGRKREIIRRLTSVIVHPTPRGYRSKPNEQFDTESVSFDWVPTKV